MNKALDIAIFNHLLNKIDVKEIFLGHIPFTLHYSIVNYTATCTEAIPFNLFDNIICELLKIEDSLSLNEIGDILGLNVYNSDEKKKISDHAEKEILIEALQSLSEDFDMIEVGDIDFSCCRLKPLGREYAEKNTKFKTTSNKPFSLYFDHTTQNHIDAKLHYEFIAGNVISPVEYELFSDEIILREIAEKQIPDIQNSQKQNSFKDVLIKRINSFEFESQVAFTYNIQDNTFKLYFYIDQNTQLEDYLTNWLEENLQKKEELIELFNGTYVNGLQTDDQLFIDYKINISSFGENAKSSEYLSKLLELNIIDYLLFLSNFDYKLDNDETNEIFICFDKIDDIIYKSLSRLVGKVENENSKFFFVFPFSIPEEIQNRIDHLKEMSYMIPNLFILQKQIISFIYLCNNVNSPYYYEIYPVSIAGKSKEFLKRNEWDDKATRIKNYLLDNFSGEYTLKICHLLIEEIQLDIEESVTKKQLDRIITLEKKISSLINTGNPRETVRQTLELSEKFKTERIEELDASVNANLTEIEDLLKYVQDDKGVNDLSKRLEVVHAQILFEDSETFIRFEKIKSLFVQKREEIEENKRVYSFIIDSNIFIDEPDILQIINPKHQFILSAKVIDELDGLKRKPECKEKAERALKNINQSLKRKNVRLNQGKLSLLPPDFNKKSPDNFILSVAIMYQKNKGILVTSDNGLQLKAKAIEIPVLSLKEFITKYKN